MPPRWGEGRLSRRRERLREQKGRIQDQAAGTRFSYSPMSCAFKFLGFFWVFFFFSSTLVRHPCFLSTFSLTNVLQLPLSSLLHTSTSATPSEHQCVRARVKLRKSRSSLDSLLCRRSTEDRRPLGQLQNNESLNSFPGLPCAETPSLPPSQALPPPFTPPPQTTDTGEWCQQATPLPRELPLGNRGKGV